MDKRLVPSPGPVKLLTRIPAVEDPQAAWLLLRFAWPRAYLLRVLAPAATLLFAAAHIGAVDRCLSALLGFAGLKLLPQRPSAIAMWRARPESGLARPARRVLGFLV